MTAGALRSTLMQRYPMTPTGHALLTAELKRQKEVVRPQIVLDIEEARAHGDISENSEYEDAKHRQALCEGRVRDLESKLTAAEVIDVTRIAPSERVIFGVTVDLEDLENEDKLRYQIVGEDYADVKEGRISVKSPLGRALIGKEVDDEVSVETPRGVRRFYIAAVHYI